jgi:hypothetical protein
MHHSSPKQLLEHLRERADSWYLRAPLVLLALCLAAASPLFAQKTDTVTLYNGNKITGEIKTLERGKLDYSTDDMGRVYVEWDKIARLFSRAYFEVELETGDKFYGSLPESPQNGRLVVQLTETVSDTVSMAQVVKITPIKSRFWTRLDGSVNIGFSYASANKVIQLNTAFTVKYRGQKWSSKLDYSGYWQRTDSTTGTTRNSITLNGQRLLKNRWSGAAYLGAEQNQELNLDLRLNLGGGGVYHPIQRNTVLLGLAAGPLVTREVFADSPDDAQYSLEFFVSGDFEAFRFDSPKLDFLFNLNIVPSITTLGRVRITADSRLSYELIKDFMVGFSVYDSYDSRAGEEGARNDLTTSITIGYTF